MTDQLATLGRRMGVAAALTVIAAGLVAPVAAHGVDSAADLSVTLTHTPEAATAGEALSFTLTVRNDGPDAAIDAVAGVGFPYQLNPNPIPETCRRGSNYESLVCDLGDVASGAVVSIDFPVRSFGSGLFSVPAAAVSDTADPNPSNSTTTDVVLVRRGAPQGERYIAGIFPIILQRPVDAGSLTYWADRWRAESNRYPPSLERVPYGLMQSNEYRRLRIREAFTRILGRPADPTGLAYWVAKASAGLTYEQIERALLISNEFRAKAPSFEERIERVYDAVLGRAPSAQELAAGAALLDVSASRFVQSVQRSTERFDQIIVERYQSALGHGPSPLGRYGWQVDLRNGKTPEQLWAKLFVLGEFLDDYPYTEDDYVEFEGGAPGPGVSVDDVVAAAAAVAAG